MPRQILIAEDHDDLRAFLVAALTRGGYRTLEAADGGAVIARLAEAPPDLVLLDLHMPVMHGLEVLRRLRATPDWAETPVLMLTASDAAADLDEARRLKARGFLVKPVRPNALVASIDRVLTDPGLAWLDDRPEPPAR